MGAGFPGGHGAQIRGRREVEALRDRLAAGGGRATASAFGLLFDAEVVSDKHWRLTVEVVDGRQRSFALSGYADYFFSGTYRLENGSSASKRSFIGAP